MTIIASSPFYQAGALVAAGPTQLNYAAELEADLVRRGVASYVGGNPQTGGLTPAMVNRDGNALVVDGVEVRTGAAFGRTALLIGHSYIDIECKQFSFGRPLVYVQGTFSWANTLLGKPYEITYGFGIGGERITDVLARMSYLGGKMFDIGVMSIGVNDLKNTRNPTPSRLTGLAYPVDANQTSVQYCLTKVEELINQTLSKCGMLFVLAESSPGNSSLTQSKQLAQRLKQYNAGLRNICARSHRAVYVPVDKVVYDPLSVTGDIKSGYYVDEIHPSALGSKRRGAMLAAHITDALNPEYGLGLADNVLETYSNQRIVATSLSVTNGTMRVMLANQNLGGDSTTRIRAGDRVSIVVPDASFLSWNGRYTVTGENIAYIDVAAPGKSGNYTGTINVSSSVQVFDNPLFTTTTGGAASGGLVLTGNLPALCSLVGGATTAATVTTAAHTDENGVADGMGNWLDIDLTLGANADVYLYMYCSRGANFPTSPYYGRVHPGDIVRSAVDLEVLGTPAGILSLEHQLYTNLSATQTANGTQASVIDHYTNTSTLHANEAFRGVYACQEWRVPIDQYPNTMDLVIYIKATAAGGNIHLRLGRAGLFVVDNPIRDVDTPFSV